MTIRQGSSKIISLCRDIVISKLMTEQYGRKIAENIAMLGTIDWQGGES